MKLFSPNILTSNSLWINKLLCLSGVVKQNKLLVHDLREQGGGGGGGKLFDITLKPCKYKCCMVLINEGRKEMFYLTTHSKHFIYDYMASDIWLRTILIVRKETRCRHIGYSFRLAARVLLYAPSHWQDDTYHRLCYTSRGALAGRRNSSVGSPREGSIRWPITPWANTLTTELHLASPGPDQRHPPVIWAHTMPISFLLMTDSRSLT